MIHQMPAYLQEPITLRLYCAKCNRSRLMRCERVLGFQAKEYARVKVDCPVCLKSITK